MYCPFCRIPRIRRLRAALSPLLTLGLLLAIGGCEGADSPLAPAEDASDAATEAPVPEEALAAITGPRIAFASYRNGNNDIYLMDPQGYNVTRLTTTSASESSPAWSWNNKRIAMVRARKDASNVTHQDIYVINADGTNGRWVLSTPSPYNLGAPSWSPDGSHLLVTITTPSGWYLGWVSLASRTLGSFSSGGNAVPGKQPSYDPTGQRIVYVGSNGRSLDLIRADGTGHGTLGLAPGPTLDGPVFSPDGKRIAFSNAAGNGDQEIFVKNLIDGTVKRLTYATGTDLWPSWSPDGSRITFSSTRNGRLQVWSMSSTGGSATRLSHNSYDERTPAYSH